jgi:hypothetical protein
MLSPSRFICLGHFNLIFVDFIIPYMQDLASKAHRGIGFVTYEHSGTIGVLLNFLSLLYMGQIKSWGTKRELLITFPGQH